MKGYITVTLVVMCMLVTPALADHGAGYSGGRASWDRVAGYFSANGGEFTIKSDGPPGLLLSNSAYSPQTKGLVSSEPFQSFCVELGEYTTDPMDVWMSTAWADGSTNPQWDASNPHFPQSHAWTGGGAGDDLNPETAYLYTAFAQGTLTGYNYNPGPRASSADQLQKAIWHFEEGYVLSGADMQAQNWVTLATGAGWTDIGSVRILQMYTTGGDLAQDMLYLVPAPGAALLGVLGLGIVGWVKRRLA